MNHSPVTNKEILARYIFTPMHLRNNGTIRWQAFKPRNGETSVTRQDYATSKRVMQLGHKMTRDRLFRLYGKVDIVTKDIRSLGLDAKAAPSPRDHNHANIVGWSTEKDEQIDFCKELLMKTKHVAV